MIPKNNLKIKNNQILNSLIIRIRILVREAKLAIWILTSENKKNIYQD
jgi:hypothetical protein